MSRHGRDLNVLGIFIHILGDALNSIAVSELAWLLELPELIGAVISAGIFMATGFIYVDPIASTFIGLMIISTSYPLLKRCGVFLLETAPESLDLAGVVEDVERITGKDTVHEMHVWSLSESPSCFTILSDENPVAQKKALATMHLR